MSNISIQEVVVSELNFRAKKTKIQSEINSLRKYLALLEVIKKNFKKMQKISGILPFLLLTMILVIYAGLEFFRHQPNLEVYQQLLDNLNQEIIVDFYVEWNASTCQSPYFPLFEYNYKRVIKGCDCTQRKNTTQELQNKSEFFNGKECIQSNLRQGCFTINQELYKNLSYLNNNGSEDQFLICAKRQKDVSLKYNYTYCQQQNKTVCKGEGIIYCLPENISCPVSEIGIKVQDEIYKNFSKINLGNNKYFYFGNNENNTPISQVYLTKGEIMCKQNNKQAFSEKEIFQENQQEDCQERDSLFKKIYAISEEQLFLSNNLIQYKNELRHFYIDKIHNWTLQAKSYTLISDICQENQYYEKIITNEFDNLLKRKKIIQIIMIFILCLFDLLIILVKHCLKLQLLKQIDHRSFTTFLIKSCLKENNQEQNNCNCNVFQTIQLIIYLSYLALILVIKYQITSIIEDIQKIINIPCIIRDDANNYLKYYLQDHPVSSFYNFCFYSFIILFVIHLIRHICRLFGVQIVKVTFIRQNF